MYFGLAVLYTDKNVDLNKISTIDELGLRIKAFLETRDYGTGIKKYIIGIICMSPEFDSERWNEEGRKYAKTKKLLEYDLKLNYVQIENTSKKGIEENVAYRLLGSLGIINR